MNSFPTSLCPTTSPTFELTTVQPQLHLFNNKFGQPGIVPIVGDKITTPFDKELRHRSKLDPPNEFVVALGAPASKNHAILVVIPGKNNLQPTWRFGFIPIPTQNREITHTEQEQMTISDDPTDFNFPSRVPNIPLDSSYIATIRPPI